MGDMTPVIAPKSDQINADDLIAGPMTITIASAKVSPGTEQPVSLGIVGDRKVFRPCKGMCRVMVQAWGADSQGFVGKSLTLYRDPDVTWGGAKVGGIRISHMSDISGPQVFAVSESKTKRKLMQVKPLAATQPVQRAPSKSAPAPAAAEGAAAGGDATPSEVAAEVIAKFKAATTVEQIDTAWKQTKEDRAWCEAADPTWPGVFVTEFKKAKTALLEPTDEVPA